MHLQPDLLPGDRPIQNDTPASRIVRCDDSHAAAWDAYLHKHPGASFYHLFAWRTLMAKNFSHPTYYLAVQDGPAVIGVLPLVLIRSRLFGKILCSMPFVNFGGICANDPDTERKLFDEAQQLAADLDVDYVELRATAPPPAHWSCATHKISMTVALDNNPDTLWNAYSTKHRTNIRRAYKNGFQVHHGGVELLDPFYEVMAESWRSLGTPIYRKAFFASILATFPERTRIFVVRAGETTVAAAFNGYHQGVVEGMWAGTRTAFRQQQPNYVLYWEMIKHACETGCHTYHLGRSTIDSNAESFKRKWNADGKQLYWQHYLPRAGAMPALNVDNPKYRLAISMWRRLPIKVTTLIGPLVANYIP